MFANLNVRERFPLESQRGLEAHPPKMTRKTMIIPLATAKITKNVNIPLEVSSALLVLQHLLTNTTVSPPEFAQTRRRLMFSLKIPKPTSLKTVKTAQDQ